MKRIVIVGASLAGVRAAEALRSRGFAGSITLVGDEPNLPYDRPPLSKQILAGTWGPERAALAEPSRYDELDLTLRLGVPARSLDISGSRVELDDGEDLPYDGLVIATGAAPRRLPGTPEAMDGIFTLRTLRDCTRLRERLGGSPRVVVVGAGFIGMEVAATAFGRGAKVTVVEALEVPFQETLGAEMGALCAAIHGKRGVAVRCATRVEAFLGDSRVEGLRLSDGSVIEADLVVVGIGVRPNTGWLDRSGLAVDDGVVCDATLAASAPRIFAAGDVARWHNPLFDESMRVEHWTNAAEQGEVAATNLLAEPGGAQPFAAVPFFWSDQFDVKLQFAGRASSEEVRVVAGSVEEERFAALYRRGDRLSGVLTFNLPRLTMVYSALIEASAPWEEALARASR